MFARLEPRTPFQGGRITETDVLDLPEAAKFASVHAGAEITPADFLRAAGRGEITLRAIVHQAAKLERVGGGVYCNAGQENENTVPAGAIVTLPLSACQRLSATGRASWRTFDGFEPDNGILMRYTVAELLPDEPDFETAPDDCRVTGNHVHALADAFKEPAPATKATANETVEERRARYLAWHTEEHRINPRGALQRVFEREAKQNPKADRANIGKDIDKARGTAKTQKQANAWTSQLVTDGKRKG